MKGRVDLNVDVGEGFAFDRDLLGLATSANVCAGAHAGSRELTRETILLCLEHGVRVGVHPGYPDRAAMGRRSMEVGEHREYLQSVFDQVRQFADFAAPAYLKPHGALYNDTAAVLPGGWDEAEGAQSYGAGGVYLSNLPGVQSLVMLLRVHRLPLMGLAPTAHRQIAERAKQPLIREGFADRAYRPDGTLVPRAEPGAVLEDPAEVRRQVLLLAPTVDSICLHGDTPGCVEFAELVRKTLEDAGYEVGA